MNAGTCAKSSPRPRAWPRGQGFTEFVAAVVPTLMLIFAVITFGMVAYTYSFVSYAAREGVRYAIVHGANSLSPADESDVRDYVRSEVQGLNASDLSVVTEWNPGTNTSPTIAAGNNKPGSVVSVQVSYTLPLFYPLSGVTIPMSSSSQMVISN